MNQKSLSDRNNFNYANQVISNRFEVWTLNKISSIQSAIDLTIF